MNSKSLKRSLEDDLTCSTCQELFKDPVTLKCGHNFCRECVHEYWKTTSPSCPNCRAESAASDLMTNCTLRNIAETYKKEVQKMKEQSEYICSQHGELLQLYCLVDQEVICAICLTSRKHEDHKCLPIEEAAQELKEELKTSVKYLQDAQRKAAEVKEKCRVSLKNIQDQTEKTEKQIIEDFVKLRQFLRREEKNLLADLKKEKEEKEWKMRAMEKRIEQDLTSVSKTVKDIQQKIDEENRVFFKTHKSLIENKNIAKCDSMFPHCEDGKKQFQLVSLLYIVIDKQLNKGRREGDSRGEKGGPKVTVTLDPNTAASRLTLSEDLTAVTCGSTKKNLPDNPERFDPNVSVLGSVGFTSGRHSWVVDVRNKTAWNLGVTKESANRKGCLTLIPECGYWIIQLRNGTVGFPTEGRLRPLKPADIPKKVLVSLDYEAGKVSFYNADNMSCMYTFTDKFTEKIFPYFNPYFNSTSTNGDPLRICP
uniref:Uncharacterized protein n=1 Tax=Latimeria chalumnae TaxID=7897 RepID=H3B6B6_LATCH